MNLEIHVTITREHRRIVKAIFYLIVQCFSIIMDVSVKIILDQCS